MDHEDIVQMNLMTLAHQEKAFNFSDWWKGLSDPSKQGYLKLHPNSRYSPNPSSSQAHRSISKVAHHVNTSVIHKNNAFHQVSNYKSTKPHDSVVNGLHKKLSAQGFKKITAKNGAAKWSHPKLGTVTAHRRMSTTHIQHVSSF